MQFSERFRGFLPVVVDLETGGFDATSNPLLEIGCQLLSWQDDQLQVADLHTWLVQPYAGSEIDPASLKVTGINPDDPERNAMPESEALQALFRVVRTAMKEASCHRAILVAHNAAFDQGFLQAACTRTQVKRNPFHPFSTLDTATLAAVAYGHTVLQTACARAGLSFDHERAHSAGYDAERTAQLFCNIVNAWPAVQLGALTATD